MNKDTYEFIDGLLNIWLFALGIWLIFTKLNELSYFSATVLLDWVMHMKDSII